MSSPRLRWIAAAALAAAVGAVPVRAQTATWYISTYTDQMLVWDEATEQVVDRITMNRIIPNGVTMNESKTRLYVEDASWEHVQIVDIAQTIEKPAWPVCWKLSFSEPEAVCASTGDDFVPVGFDPAPRDQQRSQPLPCQFRDRVDG